jgi:hypothetical protein
MSLNYKLRRAAALLERMTLDEAAAIDRRCRTIFDAEVELLARAEVLMDRCIEGCQGLCCRNVAVDEIIGLPDLVYVLQRAPSLRQRLAGCLGEEKPFFTSDCPFLENGRGPCLLPDAVRPEVCITTFCADTGPVHREIVRVRRAFIGLGRMVWWLGIKQAVRGGRDRLFPNPGQRRSKDPSRGGSGKADKVFY